MPWLPIYADNNDMENLIKMLNQDTEIAFIIYDEKGKSRSRWKAVPEIKEFNKDRICIWHIPSGNLPLCTEDIHKNEEIKDPWSGWEEKRTGNLESVPFFGTGSVSVIWLNNRTNKKENTIGLSSFEWIGNHYSMIGNKAHKSTELWWKNLRKKIGKISLKIGRDETMKPEIYCFAGAKEKIENGMQRETNPL